MATCIHGPAASLGKDMEDKGNFNISDIRNSIDVLQNANFVLSKLNEDIHRIRATNKINEYKADILEANANELEKESELLRVELENLRNQIKQEKEKSNVEMVQIEKESEHLCQLFFQGMRFDSAESVEEETRKMRMELEKRQKEY
ncbi:uncharacterized protein LOC129216078 [Uloborus diversus]|uniref:uncharacterized protein LOC129216078 n=1 Tax=Uloborus diversus TaxID=327109 RepID=UPI002409A397|nr:uncharacterized protein LOC129216078 [Uloborus diversus]